MFPMLILGRPLGPTCPFAGRMGPLPLDMVLAGCLKLGEPTETVHANMARTRGMQPHAGCRVETDVHAGVLYYIALSTVGSHGAGPVGRLRGDWRGRHDGRHRVRYPSPGGSRRQRKFLRSGRTWTPGPAGRVTGDRGGPCGPGRPAGAWARARRHSVSVIWSGPYEIFCFFEPPITFEVAVRTTTYASPTTYERLLMLDGNASVVHGGIYTRGTYGTQPAGRPDGGPGRLVN